MKFPALDLSLGRDASDHKPKGLKTKRCGVTQGLKGPETGRRRHHPGGLERSPSASPQRKLLNEELLD